LNNLLVMPRQRRAPPEDDDPFAPGGPVPNPPDIGAEARRKLAGRDFDAAEQMLREATEGPLLRDYAALRSVDLMSRHSFRGFAAWRLFLIVSGVDVDKQGSATLKEC
jgi:hypothetical protein